MVNTEHSLLVEKYRPSKLENYVGNENIKKSISKYLDQNDIQNLIFYGPAGTGKTTLAKLIVKNLDCDSLYINASDERGIETIKIVPPTKKDVAKHLNWICNEESITHEVNDLVPLVNQYYPDLRKCINTIQLSTQDNVLKLDKSILVSSNYIDKVIGALAAKWNLTFDDNKFREIRQIIADANVDDYDELFRALYERASEYLPGREGTVAIIINEQQYRANFRIDKEINTMSLISQIINNKHE